MKKIMLTLLILCTLIMPTVVSQAVPQDVDTGTAQVIAQEHKNTRKFVSDEIARQRNEFFNDMEKQAIYYEHEVDSMINDAVWKLGLMWGGIVIFVFGISNFLGRRLEKRKWNKMLSSAKAEIMTEVNQKRAEIDLIHKKKETELSFRETDVAMKKQYVDQAKPQLIQIQQDMAKKQVELKRIMQEMGVSQ